MSEASVSRLFLTIIETGVATEFLILGVATLRSAWRRTHSIGLIRPTWEHQIGACLTTTGIIFAGLAYRSSTITTRPFLTSVIFLPILFIMLMRPLTTWIIKGWREGDVYPKILPVEDKASREDSQQEVPETKTQV